ncbi:hypothetical protein niasHT_001853 [Heterodera trifolii]|uniref:Sec16 Sec23-binding domain-containing protein n=1 Tax=Heterodera trifolii TaxID=157864 RepID=A0ABD2ME27_9BILA
MNLQQRKSKMANARRSDFGEEFVERLRKDRFRKAYILVNGLSSGDEEEDEEELCFEDEDDEIASYTLDPPRPPPSVHSSRRPASVANSQRAGGAFGFDARDLYFFGVLSELTDKFTPERTARLMAKTPPPADFRSLVSIERVAYLLFFSLYGRYLSVGKFHNVFNREFFKYTSAGDSERVAFLKICRITFEEYKRRAIEHNKRAYKLSQKHMFSDGRASPDSRLSDRPSIESEDVNSIDSLAKELMFFRFPHTPVRFGRGGRIIYVDPTRSVSTVCIEDLKRFIKDAEGRRYVEILESFKGPLLVGHTPSQTPLLFIQCQINRLLQSDVYRANPSSGDANDCLLIWSLLEMLIRQHGKVTGPDLARLLCSNQPNHLAALRKNFLKSDADFVRSASAISRQDSADAEPSLDISAIERMTHFLLGGHIDEAIDSAISDGLLFDALLLAHRLFRDDKDRLEAVEGRLMAYRSPDHPITTLLSVAADQPVPLLTNPTSYETNGWRSHIAIVLANLQSPTAMNAVYQLGLALAQKEFNSAADFCFLAVNLLYGFDCFQEQQSDENHRRTIRLISATLPDDGANSFLSRFGWSILDYQATELFDFALQLANPNSPTLLSKSHYYAKVRLQYAQLLDELGGFKHAVELYRLETSNHSKTPSPPPLVPSVHKTKLAHLKRQNHEPTPAVAPAPPTFLPVQLQSTSKPDHEPTPFAVAPASHTFQPVQSASTQGQEPTAFALAPASQTFLPVQSASTQGQEPTPFAVAPVPHTFQPVQLQSVSKPDHEPTPFAVAPVPHTFQPVQSASRQDHEPTLFADASVPHTLQSVQSASMQDQEPTAFAVPSAPHTFLPVQSASKGIPDHSVRSPNSFDDRYEYKHRPSRSPSPSSAATLTHSPPNVSSVHKFVEDSKKSESGGGGGKGFLRGFLSKIKAPMESKEMKLPKDNNPKIVWDSQLGRYVDQEQEQQPQEELAPPPIMPTYQPQQWQQIAQPAEQQQPPTAPSVGRAFQGKSRYANAWNS